MSDPESTEQDPAYTDNAVQRDESVAEAKPEAAEVDEAETPFPWQQEYLSATEIMFKTMMEQLGTAFVNVIQVQEQAAIEKSKIEAETQKADRESAQQTERHGQKLGAVVAVVGIVALMIVILAGVFAGVVKEVTEATKEIVLLTIAAFGLFKWGQARGDEKNAE